MVITEILEKNLVDHFRPKKTAKKGQKSQSYWKMEPW